MTLEIARDARGSDARCGDVAAIRAGTGSAGKRLIFSLALALEEAGSNIVNHALLRDDRKTFRVMIEQKRDVFIIELRDRGPEFDPTVAASGKPQTADDAPPGGWGIQLIRRSIDETHYRRVGGEIGLRLIKLCLGNSPDHPKAIS